MKGFNNDQKKVVLLVYQKTLYSSVQVSIIGKDSNVQSVIKRSFGNELITNNTKNSIGSSFGSPKAIQFDNLNRSLDIVNARYTESLIIG